MMFCISTVALALLASSGPSGQIALVSGTDQEDQCVSIVDLASGVIRQVGPGRLDGAPVWSPDGARLAFHTRQADGIGICVLTPDANEAQALPHAHKYNRYPSWSVEGAFLAYEAQGEETFDPRIMVHDFATGAETAWGGGKTGMMRPKWMPSMKILYALRPEYEALWTSQQTAMADLSLLKSGLSIIAVGLAGDPAKPNMDVYIVTADAAVALPQWVYGALGTYPEWAVTPNATGEAIALETTNGGDREIFTMSKKGPADVSNHRAADWNPVWSPDGEWIAFESFRGGRRGVYRVHAETARVLPVAVDAVSDNWSPVWSSDGEWIAFVSNRTGNPDLFVADIHGENVRQLTDQPGSDGAPVWRPKVKEK